MTSNSDKIRSLILAALMVFSVFAGTIALTGSAAAANNASVVSLSNADDTDGDGTMDVSDGETVQHTLIFDVDNVGGDGTNDDQVNVTLPAGQFQSVDYINVSDRSTDASVSTNDVTTTNNGQSATFDIAEDGTTRNVEIAVTFTAAWPERSSDTSGDVLLSVTDSNGNINEQTLATVQIIDSTASQQTATALNSGGTFYAGEDVYVAGLDTGTDYQVRELDSDGRVGSLERTLESGSNGVVEFTLDGGLSDGDFMIVDENGDPLNVSTGVAGTADASSPTDDYAASQSFEVVTQDLTAEFEDTSVGNDGDTADVEYEIASDVRNTYTVNISAQGDLDTDELSGIFGGENVSTNYTDDDIVTVNLTDTTAEGTYDLNFSDVDPGTYTFEANVTDSTASDVDDIEVTDTGDDAANFDKNVYSDQVGDVVNITIQMDNTDTATVQVGETDESSYTAIAEVVDDDEDGVAYVEFNSFAAGNSTLDSDVLTAGDDDTDVSEQVQLGNFDGQNEPAGSNLLEDGDYNMYVTAGESDGTEIVGDDDARATLSLAQRSTDSMTIWTAPEDSLDDLQDTDADGISAYATANNLTTSDTIARNDTVVVQVSASGLEGALELGSSPTSFYNSTSAAGTLFNLTFDRKTGSLNQDGDGTEDVSNLTTGNYSVIYDGEGDTHYVVIDSKALTDVAGYSDGDDYEANFTIYGDDGPNNELAEDGESVTSEFSVENEDLELDANADDMILLNAAAGQEVSGTTNLAPGTEVEVELNSDTSTDPFVKRPDAIVAGDGTFTAVADFSDNNVGSLFTATASVNNVDSEEVDGELQDGGSMVTPTATTDDSTQTATETETETQTQTQTETETQTQTQTDTGGMTTTEGDMEPDASPTEGGDSGGNATEEATTGGSGPGFTAAIALIALIAAALLAVRRDN